MKSMNLIAQVSRGDQVESSHHGHIAVVRSDGTLISSFGDPNFKTFFRSAMKPFQAVTVITSGAASHYKFSFKEIAIISASHAGEPMHIKVVQDILKKVGISETTLHCGPTFPLNQKSTEKIVASGKTRKRIYHNCSGKHAGLLAAAKCLGKDFRKYFQPEHILQEMIFDLLSQFCGVTLNKFDLGVDGCGLPNASLPLKGMALGYARIGEELENSPIGTIGKAMASHPWFVAGTKIFDTELMRFFKGRLIAKRGAEGVFCISVPSKKLGIAIKSEDGSARPIPAVAISLLNKLGLIKKNDMDRLFASNPQWCKIENSRKEIVGEISPLI